MPVAAGSAGGAFHPVAGELRRGRHGAHRLRRGVQLPRAGLREHRVRAGPRRALAVFERSSHGTRTSSATAIGSSTSIGSATYARYEGDVARTFAQGSSTCASGYYHGILERAFVGITSKAKLAEAARELCVGSRDTPAKLPRLPVPTRPRARLHDPDRLRPSDSRCRSAAGSGSGWDRVTLHERRVHGERQHAVRLPVVVARRGGSALPVQSRRSTASALLLRARDDVDSAGREERLPTHSRPVPRRRAHVGGRVFPWLRSRRSRRGAVPRLPQGPPAVQPVGPVCGRLLLRSSPDVRDGEGLEGARRAAAFCASAPEEQRAPCAGGFGVVVGLVFATPEGRQRACDQLAQRYTSSCAKAAEAEVDPSGRGAWG